MFGRRATLPVDINLHEVSVGEKYQQYHEAEDPNISMLENDRKDLLEQAKKNIVEAQEKPKEQYDRKHAKPEYFQVDQLVLRKDLRGRKLQEGNSESAI